MGKCSTIIKPAATLSALNQGDNMKQLDINKLKTDMCAASKMKIRAPRILVVDDDVASLVLMRTVLLAEHYLDVSVFQDAQKAQAAYQANQYDILIVDLRMPGLSGFDILRDLQARHDNRSSIIVLTANVEAGAEIRALKLGARKVFLKPFYIPDLIQEVKLAVKDMAA